MKINKRAFKKAFTDCYCDPEELTIFMDVGNSFNYYTQRAKEYIQEANELTTETPYLVEDDEIYVHKLTMAIRLLVLAKLSR